MSVYRLGFIALFSNSVPDSALEVMIGKLLFKMFKL